MDHPVLDQIIEEMAVTEITIKPAPNNLLPPQDKEKLHPLNKTLTTVLIERK